MQHQPFGPSVAGRHAHTLDSIVNVATKQWISLSRSLVPYSCLAAKPDTPEISQGKELQESSWSQNSLKPAGLWWDSRFPDLRHKVAKEPLWPDLFLKPHWVDEQLRVFQKGFGMTGQPSNSLVHQHPGLTMVPDCQAYAAARRAVTHLCEYGQLNQAVTALTDLKETQSVVPRSLLSKAINRCAAEKDLVLGRQLDDLIVELGYESDLVLCTCILRMYACQGRLRDAMKVFKRVVKPDALMWLSILSAHSEHGDPCQAVRLYHEMRRSGLEPDNQIFLTALQACARAEDVESGRQVHADVVESGVQPDSFVCSCLVDLYAKCGELDNALQVYQEMQEQGVKPHERTFVSLLKACATIGAQGTEAHVHRDQRKLAALAMGREIHGYLALAGYELSVFLGSALVHMYANSGSIVDAQGLFEKLSEQNVVTWTTLLAAYAQGDNCSKTLDVYSQMLENGVLPNEWSYVNLLKACASLAIAEEYANIHGVTVKLKTLHQGKHVHAEISRAGFEYNPVIGNSLLHFYASCASMVDAQILFDCLPQRSVVTWTALISGYVDQDEGDTALALYAKMQEAGVIPNERTFVCVLKALTSVDGSRDVILEKLKKLHAETVKQGYELDVFVGSTLVHSYANCGSMVEAKNLFDQLSRRDVVAWTALIAGYVQEGNGGEALQLYTRMQKEGVRPNSRTFVSLIKACVCLGDMENSAGTLEKSPKELSLEKGRLLHAEIIANGCHEEVFVGSTLVDMYVTLGSIQEAREVFETMSVRDASSWNAIILGYGQQHQFDEALHLFARMHDDRVSPNESTFLCILDVCSTAGALQETKQIHKEMTDRGLASRLALGNTLVHAYGKCGSMVDAQRQFDSLDQKDVVSWNALIAGYARLGQCEMSLKYFEEMKGAGIGPDAVTFTVLLSACSHNGLVDRGLEVFQLMRHEYAVTPSPEHYVSMIDLLSRAGLFAEVKDILLEMPVQPSIEVWLSLLGACRKHGNVELGREAFEQAVMLDPTHGAAYMLMSNVYNGAQMVEDSRKIEELRSNCIARRDLGQSWNSREERQHFLAAEILSN